MENLNSLLPISENNGKKAVNARALHAFLGSKRDFSNWIKDRIDKYDFIENQDYVVFNNFGENPKGGRPQIEYALSIGMAKELSMVEGNEKGKQARKYFIACEESRKELSRKEIQQYPVPQSYGEALMLAAQQQMRIEEQQKRLEQKDEEITELRAENVELQHQSEYARFILQSKKTVLVTQIAQDYGMTAIRFNALLRDLRIQRKVNGQWILYGEYLGKGYVHSATHNYTHSNGSPDVSLNTEWTQKGRLFLYEELKRNGILPLIERSDKN